MKTAHFRPIKPLLALIIAAALLHPAPTFAAGPNNYIDQRSNAKVDQQSAATLNSLATYAQTLNSFSVQVASVTAMADKVLESTNTSIYSLAVQRPNRLALTPVAGALSTPIVSNGRNAYIYDPMAHNYLTKKAPPQLRNLFEDRLTATILTQNVPLLDILLGTQSISVLIDNLALGKHLGSETIDSIPHQRIKLAFNAVELTLWVTDDEKPLIRRIVVDWSKMLQQSGRSQITVTETYDFTNWQLNPDLTDEAFVFNPPLGAELAQEQSQPTGPPDPMLSQPAPDFKLTQLDGKEVMLSSHKNKNIVILDFWATWCVYCRQAMPYLNELAQQYRDQGVVLYAVNERESPQMIRQFLKKLNINPPVLLDSTGNVANLFNARGLPHTVIVGKDQIIRAVHTGFAPGQEQKIKQDIDALLAGTDIICKSASFQPETITPGDKITFSAVLANPGSNAIAKGTYKVGLAVNDMQVYLALGKQNIPPRGQITYTATPDDYNFHITTPGSFGYQLTVNPDNQLPEADRANNTINGILTVVNPPTPPSAEPLTLTTPKKNPTNTPLP